MKKQWAVLFAAMILLSLAGCQKAPPAPTIPTETPPAEEPTAPMPTYTYPPGAGPTVPQPTAPRFPAFEDPDWELYHEDYGVYQYIGDMTKIELSGYTLTLPAEWQDRVTVLRGNPGGYDTWTCITGTGLKEAYEDIDDLWGAHADYIVWIYRVPKSEEDGITVGRELVEEGKRIVAWEDETYVCFVSVHSTADGQELFAREELISKIGQEAYDELIAGLDCTLEEAAAMITVG